MLELDDCRHRVLAHVFDRVLVAEPVGPLDRVVHVPAPVVLAHITERGADAALRRDSMAAGRKDLADAGGFAPCGGHPESCAQTRSAATDDNDIVAMVLDRISPGHASAFVFSEMWHRPQIDTIGNWRSLASSNPKDSAGMRFDLSDLRL